jgi:hypothetical protein
MANSAIAPSVLCLLLCACASTPGPAEPAPVSMWQLPMEEILYLPVDALETWPEERRGRVLPFLAACRHAADAFVATWKTGDVDALYREVTQELRDGLPPAEFARTVADIRTATGLMDQATFSLQALAIPRADEEARGPLYSEVSYSVFPASWTDKRGTFVMGLEREGRACRVTSFSYSGIRPRGIAS